jgi:hypothetical protein
VIKLTFNGHPQSIVSVEDLGQALNRFDTEALFELWALAPAGPSMCMLRNGTHAWLLYLRHPADSGFCSVGNAEHAGSERYVLSNGQADEYPLAWCIEVEQCYKAVAYFFVNDGERPDWVNWHET